MLTPTQTKPINLFKKSSLVAMTLFQGVSLAGLREIEQNMVEKKYEKKAILFQENDAAQFIWFVQQGHVKEVSHSEDGRAQTVGMVGSNGMFGVSSFDGGEYGFSGIAETNVTVIYFPVSVFQTLMGQYPSLARMVVAQISKLLRQSKQRQAFSRERAEKRLLHVLLEMSEEFGRTIPLTHREIASMAGTSPETCSRTFSRLETAGLIMAQHGKFKVNDLNELKSRMNEF